MVAFEMDAVHSLALAENVKANKQSNVRVEQNAVARESGRAHYVRPHQAADPTLHLTCGDRLPSPRTKLVVARSIDDYTHLQGLRPDVVKIDVEGSETAVLEGMVETIARFRPVLFVEIHRSELSARGESFDSVFSLLRSFGYQLEHIEDMHGYADSAETAPVRDTRMLPGNAMILARLPSPIGAGGRPDCR